MRAVFRSLGLVFLLLGLNGSPALAQPAAVTTAACKRVKGAAAKFMVWTMAATCSAAVLSQSKKSGRTKPDEPTPWLMITMLGSSV